MSVSGKHAPQKSLSISTKFTVYCFVYQTPRPYCRDTMATSDKSNSLSSRNRRESALARDFFVASFRIRHRHRVDVSHGVRERKRGGDNKP